jgi:DNA-binding transcriptional LysR family regulator
MARATGGGRRGTLLIGISPAIDSWLYFRIRVVFNRQYPDVQMEPVTASAIQLAERLMRSELHAGLIELPIRHRGLSVVHVSQEPIIFAISEKDALASEKTIEAKDIHQRTLVLVSDDADLAYHKIIADLASRGYRPKRVQPVLTASQALDFVAAEQSIAAVRAGVARFRTNGVTYRPIDGFPMFDTGLVYRRSSRTPTVGNLLRVIRQELLSART